MAHLERNGRLWDLAVMELNRRIRASGLSVEDCARSIFLREPQTVKRWLSKESRIPKVVQEYLFDEWSLVEDNRGGDL